MDERRVTLKELKEVVERRYPYEHLLPGDAMTQVLRQEAFMKGVRWGERRILNENASND